MSRIFYSVCIMTVMNAVCYANVPFETLRQYPTGLYTTGILAGDLDGDGDIDLVTANRGTADVTVLFNAGNGLYPESMNFPTGLNPRYVHGGDFDGDGDIDLCTPDYTGMTETILDNDGNGHYSIHQQITLETPAFSWVDDIDGDGHLDILVTHWDEEADTPSQNPAKFTPLLNNGDGTFFVGPSTMIGNQPRCGASADLNGDGIKDVLVANYWSSTISIILGLGKRQWADEIQIQLTGQPRYLVVGDFDDDEAIRAARASYEESEDSMWVFHNDGNASFSLEATRQTNATPHSVDTGDIDLDGDLDIIVTHVGSGQQLLFHNEGNGLFPTSQSLTMTGGPAEVKFADVDGDGYLDVVSGNVNNAQRGASVLMQGTCEGLDCNNNGIEDICELPDCNVNGVPDDCDIASGFSFDTDSNGVPDECQTDCNDNGFPDEFEIAEGMATDCNENELPDDCDWAIFADCDEDGLIDGCEVDLNEDWVPDDCQCIADFTGDGKVAIHDLLQLVAAWGENPIPHGDPVEEDLNVDMEVNIQDLLILIAAWGDCPDGIDMSITGACCYSQFMCEPMTDVACAVTNGTYNGDDSVCEDIKCQSP